MRVAQARIALVGEGGRQVTQDELADLVAIHRVTMNRIEAGTARVSLDVLERLSVVLGRSREWLLGEPDPIDELALARDRVASALAKIGEGFEDFTGAVDLLYERARGVEIVEVQA